MFVPFCTVCDGSLGICVRPPDACVHVYVCVRVFRNTQYNKTKSTSRCYVDVDWETFSILFFVFVVVVPTEGTQYTSPDVAFHIIIIVLFRHTLFSVLLCFTLPAYQSSSPSLQPYQRVCITKFKKIVKRSPKPTPACRLWTPTFVRKIYYYFLCIRNEDGNK